MTLSKLCQFYWCLMPLLTLSVLLVFNVTLNTMSVLLVFNATFNTMSVLLVFNATFNTILAEETEVTRVLDAIFIMIMCLSGATCVLLDCWFSELPLA